MKYKSIKLRHEVLEEVYNAIQETRQPHAGFFHMNEYSIPHEKQDGFTKGIFQIDSTGVTFWIHDK